MKPHCATLAICLESCRRCVHTLPATACRHCTFVPEFNSVRCAEALLDAGADVNAPAAVDADGLGGQTPLFHAVNSNGNYCRPMMELLVQAGADLDVRLKGLVWGKTMPWETVLFDVTLFSYAQCGLYRQFHRREEDVYSNLTYLHQKRYGTAAAVRNVPNQYLAT